MNYSFSSKWLVSDFIFVSDFCIGSAKGSTQLMRQCAQTIILTITVQTNKPPPTSIDPWKSREVSFILTTTQQRIAMGTLIF